MADWVKAERDSADCSSADRGDPLPCRGGMIPNPKLPDRSPPCPLGAQSVLRAALVCLLFVSGACGGSDREVGQGLLVIAVDGLRADHLASYGYDRETSPTLDELAADGVLFSETFAAAPWLIPAHIALLAGTEPSLGQRSPEWAEKMVERRWRVPEVLATGAVEMLAAGWSTAAFSDHEWLSPGFGFARGFQVFEYSDLDAPPQPGGSGAAGLVPKLERWVRSRDRDERWFAYLHVGDLLRNWRYADAQWDTYFEPRPELASVPPVGSVEPVFFAVPPARWSGGSEPLGVYEARYDGSIRRLDEDLRRLFDTLRLVGRWDATNICVVGAHGLQFGESGLVVDSGRLSMADLEVPWIVRPASGHEFRPGRRVTSLASTVDVLPTLLDLVGLKPPLSMTGRSQLAQLRGDASTSRSVAFASCGLQFGYAAIGRRWVYERTHPGLATHPALLESWFGDRDVHGEHYELLYDRHETRYPPLDALEDFAFEGTSELERRAREWFLAVESARSTLQRVRLGDDLKLEALATLRMLQEPEGGS